MPETITCEHCNATLRLPEQFIGQEVRCPSCKNIFTAKLPAGAPPAPTPEQPREQPVASISPEPSADERPSRRQPRGDDDDYPRRRPRYDDDDAYSTRRFGPPDRSGTVQVLGILSLVCVGLMLCVSIFGIVGFALGLTAVIMGRNDLAAMDRGERDPAGRSATKTGVVCGTIAMISFGVLFVLGCGFVILMITLNPH